MKFYSLFLAFSSLIFTSTSNFSLVLYRFYFLFQQAHCKIEERVRQSKPLAAKLAIVKNTSSKSKRRSHRITSKLESSNTQDSPIEIKEAE